MNAPSPTTSHASMRGSAPNTSHTRTEPTERPEPAKDGDEAPYDPARMNARSIAVSTAAIARERGRRGWTSQELARRAGVSAQTLSNINRSGHCSAGVLRALARAFAKEKPEAGIDTLLADVA